MATRTWRRIGRPSLPLLALACASCGSSGPPESAPLRSIDYELFPSTHQLSLADTAAISEVAEDGTLRFSKVPSALAGISVGDVIVTGISGATPRGLLRVVMEIEASDGDGLILRTAAAPLQLAFRKLHAHVGDQSTPFKRELPFQSTDLTPLSEPGLRPRFSVGGDLGDHEHYQVVVFDGDGNTDTTNDQVAIDTTLGGGLRFELSIDVDWGAVDHVPEAVTKCVTNPANLVKGPAACLVENLMPEMILGFEVDPHLEAALAVSGAASVGFEKAFDIGSITLAPITLGPLVFQPVVDIVATVGGKASARFSANAHANIEASTKVTLSSKSENSEFLPFALKHVDADAQTPEIDLYAEASAKAGVRFSMTLYGVVGPYAQLQAAAALIANPIQDPCWDFHVGLETQFGVLVKTPTLPVIGAYTFLDWNTGAISLYDTSVAHGECDVTAEGASPPPGGGPSAITLQKPPFTPWAKLLGLGADGSDLASVLAFPSGFPSLTPSVDGRYVASGGRARGLLKLDADGNPTWQTGLVDGNDRALTSLGSVASGDAGLLTLYASGSSDAFVLAKQGQSGALIRAVGIGLPDVCGASAPFLAGDSDGGALVVGECPFSKSAWLVRLDSDLKIVDSREIVDSDKTTTRLTPSALTAQDDGWLLAGQLSRNGEAAGALGFTLRLAHDLSSGASAAYACPERLSFYPSAAIPSAAGSVTLVGDAAGLGFVARVKANGSLGFVRFPNLGGGVQSGFSPNAVVELPTTGLVLASTVSGEGDNPTDVILLGLDGNGQTAWGREYFLKGKNGLRAFGWPSARLTDDGGVLLTATAGPEGSSPGELLGMKVFARDGSLPDDSLISNNAITPEESNLQVELRELRVSVGPLTATSREFSGSAR